MIFDTSPLLSGPSLFAGVPIEPSGLSWDKGSVHKFDVEKKLPAPQTTRDSQPVSTSDNGESRTASAAGRVPSSLGRAPSARSVQQMSSVSADGDVVLHGIRLKATSALPNPLPACSPVHQLPDTSGAWAHIGMF